MTQIKVERKLHNDNPFYGLKANLLLFQNGGNGSVNVSMLNAAWKEAENDATKRQLFFTILFAIGDVTAREHNVFKGNKVDAGGNAQREAFRTILAWMLNTTPDQYWKFVFSRMINEYTTFDNLFSFRVKTKKKTNVVEQLIIPSMGEEVIKKLASFAAMIIQKGSDDDKRLIAKFITRPRFSKRRGHKQMLPKTKIVMHLRNLLLTEISNICGFTVEVHEKYVDYPGYYAWRKPYISEGITMLESVAFSSKSVLNMDEQGFYAWLEAMPASARYRVRTRILTKDNQVKPKWNSLGHWYLNWEKFKSEKQSEQRVLEEKIRQIQTQGSVTKSLEEQELTAKFEEVKKQAKVTTGAVNFEAMFHEIILGTIDRIKVQPFLDKVVLPYNNLVFIDDSASMQLGYASKVTMNNANLTAFDFATFIAAISLMKNPDDTGRNLLGFFSSTARLVGSITAQSNQPNKLMRAVNTTQVSLPLYNPEMHFLDNLHNIRALAYSMRTGNGTDISSIPEYLHSWARGDSSKIEQLMNFPVWTIITDGNWNNLHSPEHSMNDFMAKCERYFGFKPFVVAIDVSSNPVPADRFQGIENMILVQPNPIAIQQFLTNFKDMDIMDVYTPLLSLYRSNRYDLIRANTL